MVTTSMRSAGGKNPWPTGPRGVLQTCQALVEVAVTPQADGMTVTVEFGSDLEIGRLIVVRSA
jgi:hypothetical protein